MDVEEIKSKFQMELKKLALGTFETDLAGMTYDYHNGFDISFEFKSVTYDIKFDRGDIAQIEQHYELNKNYIRLIPHSSNADNFMCMIPEGFVYAQSDDWKKSRFIIELPDELSINEKAALSNMFSSITPLLTDDNELVTASEFLTKMECQTEVPKKTFKVSSEVELSSPVMKKSKKESKSNKLIAQPFLTSMGAAIFDDDMSSDENSLDSISNKPKADVISEIDLSRPLKEKAKKDCESNRQLFHDSKGNEIFDDDKAPSRKLRSKSKRIDEVERDDLEYNFDDEIPDYLLEKPFNEPADVKIKPKAPSEFDRFDDLEELLCYPPDSDNIIRMEDYKCLDRRELINNVILDFYLQYLHREMLSEEMRQRVHICSSYFYNLYSTSSNYTGWKDDENKQLCAADKRYRRVKDLPCNKNVNIFEKDFVVIPCIDKEHWFLAIACFMRLNGPVTYEGNEPLDLDCVFRDKRNPTAGVPVKMRCILVFDSVRGNGGRRTKAMIHIKNFFESEYKEKYQADFPFEKKSIMGGSVMCPQQSNATDCGLFVLEFFEHFLIKSPITDFRLLLDFGDWFNPKIVLEKRRIIAKIIQRLIIEAKGALPELPQISFSDDSKEIEETVNNGNDNNNEKEFNNNNDFNAVNNNRMDEVSMINERDPLYLYSTGSESGPEKLDELNLSFINFPRNVSKHESNKNAQDSNALKPLESSKENLSICVSVKSPKQESEKNKAEAAQGIDPNVIVVDSD